MLKAKRRIALRSENCSKPRNAERTAVTREATRNAWSRRFSTLNIQAQMMPIAAAKSHRGKGISREFVRA